MPYKTDFEISEGAVISLPVNPGKVLLKAVEDFADYLLVSHGVSVLISDHKKGDITFEILSSENLSGKKACEYSVKIGDSIKISAYNEKGLAQALYKLEFQMNVKKAPFLKKGKTDYTPLFSPRMVHSALGLDMYPDGYLSRLAHRKLL